MSVPIHPRFYNRSQKTIFEIPFVKIKNRKIYRFGWMGVEQRADVSRRVVRLHHALGQVETLRLRRRLHAHLRLNVLSPHLCHSCNTKPEAKTHDVVFGQDLHSLHDLADGRFVETRAAESRLEAVQEGEKLKFQLPILKI